MFFILYIHYNDMGNGISINVGASKIYDEYDNCDIKKIGQDKVMVIFFQVRKNKECILNAGDLRIFLSDDINKVPKHTEFDKLEYPYLFCADSSIDIKRLCEDFGFDVGLMTKQVVLKSQFNSNYRTDFNNERGDIYKLVKDKN